LDLDEGGNIPEFVSREPQISDVPGEGLQPKISDPPRIVGTFKKEIKSLTPLAPVQFEDDEPKSPRRRLILDDDAGEAL
jgi:hypothetical protein